jgi:hypothetical protein
VRADAALAAALVADLTPAEPAVLAVHAEVEGGPYAAVLDHVVARMRAAGRGIRTIGAYVASIDVASLPVHDLAFKPLAGRSGRVATADV